MHIQRILLRTHVDQIFTPYEATPPEHTITMAGLASVYQAWLDCISKGKWNELLTYMHSKYNYNGKEFAAEDFVQFVKKEGSNFTNYTVNLDVIFIDDNAQRIACRLYGKGKPAVKMFGYDPTGVDVVFVEQHIVWFTSGKISRTLYVLDIPSVRYQLMNPTAPYVLDLVDKTPVPKLKTLSHGGLEDRARAFFDSINARTMASELPKIMHSELWRDGRQFKLNAYLALIDKGISALPDLQFDILESVADQDTQRIFVRLEHHCTPVKEFAGLVPNGKATKFVEHTIFQFEDGKISRMWSIVDWEAARRRLATI